VSTALVLSAGGLFGAYQAGVWAELENTLHPDLVVGASIGALNGWMIAGGASARELIDAWLEPPDARARRLNRDIAERLFISEETVKVHVKHIMEKLDATDRTQAVAIGVRRGIIQL